MADIQERPFVKEVVIDMIRRLPDDCTFDDIKYQIYLAEQVSEGLADFKAGRVMTQETAENEIASWRKSSGRGGLTHLGDTAREDDHR